MFSNLRKYSNKSAPYSKIYKEYSTHSKFIIVGGGTAGISTAHQLISNDLATRDEITIFDPAKYHYYQPGFTKLAGGVIKSKYILNNFIKYDMKELTNFVKFQNQAISQFLPEEDAVVTSNGDKFTYKRLIIAAGLQVNFNAIPGLNELITDPNSSVCSIFEYNHALKTKKLINSFKGGKAIFTQHSAPIKCAGAPQKILYLAHDEWDTRFSGKYDIDFYTPLPGIFGVPYYAVELKKLAERKGISIHNNQILSEIDSKYATFKNNISGELTKTKYDFIHVSPPMSAPSFLKGLPVSDASGFVETTPELRHKKYPRIYAAGDCVSLPCAKTASAVFAQVPIMVQNMKKDMTRSIKVDGKYNGYSACPIYLKKGSLMLSEFKTFQDQTGNTVTTPEETFMPGKQTIPRRDFYYITKSLTFMYYIAMKNSFGKNWYGSNVFFKPKKKILLNLKQK